MKRLTLFGLILSISAMGGCAMGGPKRVVKEEPPRLMLVGVDQIPSDIEKEPLFVSFNGSAAMTDHLRNAFENQGFRIASDKAGARYSLVVDGHFTSMGIS